MPGRTAFALRLFDSLWKVYRARVPHVRTYERVLRETGASFINDHVAFRTLATLEPASGIFRLSRLFEALDYVAEATYVFPDKHLGSIHYRHPDPRLPKLFISELKTWELPQRARRILARSLRRSSWAVSDKDLAFLRSGGTPALLRRICRYIWDLPWPAPEAADVLALDRESQFGAWVLVHGNAVNHFTSSINAHKVAALDDIEKTVATLRAAGVPMKAEVEGAKGSKLRQSATEAAMMDVAVTRDGKPARMPWTYAYFELAERGLVKDPETGRTSRFEGFLGGQATQLFEMTRRR